MQRPIWARSRATKWGGAVLACVVASLPRPAIAADAASAKVLFDGAIDRMAAGDYDAACPALEKSQALDPHPGTLFALADCEAFRHHLAAAFARYGEYLAVYATLPRDKQARQGTRPKEAREKRAELERVLPALTLALPSDAPEGATVTLDDAAIAADSLGAATRVDPGDHVVVTCAPGRYRTVQHFSLADGETLALTLKLGAPEPVLPERAEEPVAEPPPRTTAPRRDLHGTTAFVASAVAGGGLVVGSIAGVLMLSKKDAVAEGCRDGRDGVAICTAAGASAGNSAKAFGAVATAGFAAALLGAGVAVVAIATRPNDGSTGARSGRGRRIEIGALGVSSSGTILGARGTL